jgi:Fic family protein
MSPQFVRDKPFNELPLLPPKQEIETKSILKKVISARTALESLKQAGKTIPNQAVLLRSIVLQLP